jgi:hypothetical protein
MMLVVIGSKKSKVPRILLRPIDVVELATGKVVSRDVANVPGKIIAVSAYRKLVQDNRRIAAARGNGPRRRLPAQKAKRKTAKRKPKAQR